MFEKYYTNKLGFDLRSKVYELNHMLFYWMTLEGAAAYKFKSFTSTVFAHRPPPTLISGGRVSQRTAGSPSRKSVPETSVGGAEAVPSLRRDGWMSCWKNRQKKWSSLGAWSALQNALQSRRTNWLHKKKKQLEINFYSYSGL